MIKCPATLEVGPLTYRVRRVSWENGNFGEAHEEKQELRLIGRTSPTRHMVTLVHEYMHAYEFTSRAKTSEGQMTEDQVRLASHAAVTLMKQLGMDCELDLSELEPEDI